LHPVKTRATHAWIGMARRAKPFPVEHRSGNRKPESRTIAGRVFKGSLAASGLIVPVTRKSASESIQTHKTA